MLCFACSKATADADAGAQQTQGTDASATAKPINDSTDAGSGGTSGSTDSANPAATGDSATQTGTPDDLDAGLEQNNLDAGDSSVSSDGGSDLDASATQAEADARPPWYDASPEDLAYFPPEIPNTPLDIVAGTLVVTASTLTQGPNGFELYAAVENQGELPLCSAAMMVEFYDQADLLIGTASGGVHSGRRFQFTDGSGTTVFCVAPGQTAVAALTELPEDLVLKDLKYMGYRCPAFALDALEELDNATLSDIAASTPDTGTGTVYTGTLANQTTSAASYATVLIFPVNRVGRPLGIAIASEAVGLAPGEAWTFETSAVTDSGEDYLAFAEVTFSQ